MAHKNGDNGHKTAPDTRRILIMRALPGLGDFLCCVPAWRALRTAFPEAHITLLGLPQIVPLVQRFHNYLDDFLEFPGFPGIIERPPAVQELPPFLQQVQSEGYDLALQMHGDGSVSNLFTVLLGARRTAGFYLPPHYCHDVDTFLPYPSHLSEVQRHLALIAYLGIAPQGVHLEFPLSDSDYHSYDSLAARHGLEPGRFVCLHPGASSEERRWPAARFASVGDFLSEQGLQVVLTGAGQEKSLTRAVAAQMRSRPLDLAGKTDQGTLALLLHNALLLVCNDTGVSHLAAATRTPSVVLFLASDTRRWAPLDRKRHRVVSAWNDEEQDEPTLPASPGQISTDAVLQEVKDLLDEQPVVQHATT